MTGVVCDHYSSSLVTPQQSFPQQFQAHGPDGYINCVSYVPCQQGGFVVGNNYNFSEGYTIDPCCNYNPYLYNENNWKNNNNNFNYSGSYNFSNDYSFAEGLNFYNGSNLPENDPDLNGFENTNGMDGGVLHTENAKEFFEANATQTLPEGFNEEGKTVPLTPSFFASNAAFKRIPLQPGRKIFRRRKPGDCASEWSNAFDKDYDDGLCWAEEVEDN